MRTRPVKILFIEDNPEDVRLLEVALAKGELNHQLHPVNDGREALSLLQSEGADSPNTHPDLILLDLNLPHQDGWQLLKQIKSDPDLRRIPVIVLTASSADEDVLAAYDLHANCFLPKPMDLDAFNQIIQSIEAFWLTIVKLPGG